MRSRSNWKAHERTVATLLDGERQPLNGKHGPDVLSERYSVEVKTRRALPDWITGAMKQAEQGAGERVPLVVLVLAPGRGVKAQRFALLKLEDLREAVHGG